MSKIHLTLAFGLISLFGFWYYDYFDTFPYYHAWDMDHTVANDMYVVSSGYLPVLLHHPSFGTYFTQSITHRIARSLGSLSVMNYDDLRLALNPMAAAAEHVTFCKAHQPFVALATVILLWVAFVVAFRPGIWVSLVVLGAIGAQESFLVHSTLIRSALYGVLGLAVTLLAFALASREGSQRRLHGYLMLAGAGACFAFLCKFQAFFLIFVFLILGYLIWMYSSRSFAELRGAFESELQFRKVAALLSGSVLAFFLLATYLAYFHLHLDPNTVDMRLSYKINLFCKVMCAFLAVNFALLLTAYIEKRKEKNFGWITRPENLSGGYASALLSAGFFGCFALHFLVYPSFYQSGRYLLANFKEVFIRKGPVPSHFGAEYWAGKWNIVEGQYALYPGAFWVFFGVLILFGIALILKKIERPKRVFWFLGALLSFILATIALTSRPQALQDVIWVEFAINTTSIVLLGLLLSNRTKWVKALSIALLVGLLWVNLAQSERSLRRVEDTLGMYGWRDHQWFVSQFGGMQSVYGHIMTDFFTPFEKKEMDREMMIHSRLHAKRWEQTRKDFEFLLTQLDVNHRKIGILAEGFPLEARDHSLRIEDLPDEIKGLPFYDVSDIDLDWVYGRRDLMIYILADRDDLQKSCGTKETALLDDELTAKKGDREIEYRIYRTHTACKFRGRPPKAIAYRFREDRFN